MPLLNPPSPVIPTRQYRVRIEEPLAAMMERYAEFLGATTVDHVIGEALAFVFKKDGDFKDWLAQHPSASTPTHASEPRKVKPNGTGAAKRSAEMSATAGATI